MIESPSLQTKGISCTRPSVNANYLTDYFFWQEEILFLRLKLENKQKTIQKLFNILRSNNNETTKPQSSTEKKLSENIKTNNSIINIDNDSFITNSHQSNFKKD